ncbi:hypothetical protein MPCS_01659 (plasmid) [Candidatus Megaera polyxenophila]|nr:hypothetical protein MPCS_01659 [Candidatus Megaera polyxenophila]
MLPNFFHTQHLTITPIPLTYLHVHNDIALNRLLMFYLVIKKYNISYPIR